MTKQTLLLMLKLLADQWDSEAGCDQPSITNFNDGKRIAYNDCAERLRKLTDKAEKKKYRGRHASR